MSSAESLSQLVDDLVVDAESNLGGKELQQLLVADGDVPELDLSRARELQDLRVGVFEEGFSDPQVRLGAAGRGNTPRRQPGSA
jgi:hypothetical protein